jgi:hypothetical protein
MESHKIMGGQATPIGLGGWLNTFLYAEFSL